MAKDDLLDELRPAARPLVWGSRVIFVIAWCLLSSGDGRTVLSAYLRGARGRID